MGKGKRFIQPKNYKPELAYLGVIFDRFMREVRRHGMREVLGDNALDFKKVETEGVTVEMLKTWRTRLSRMVRRGMNERKNLELEIAYLAAVVWFLRMMDEENWTEVPSTMW